MTVRVIFRCEICERAPDRETPIALEHQLLDLRHGEYVDADPGNRLTWHGRGSKARPRYACGSHLNSTCGAPGSWEDTDRTLDTAAGPARSTGGRESSTTQRGSG
jgi:hypothetical protein